MKKGLQGFRKKAEKMGSVITSSRPPHLWLNTGFYSVNKVISGSYNKGWANGRLGMVTGPSDAGKSLFAMSAAVQAQKAGYGVFILDTEFALDDDYMSNVGLDVNDEFFFFNKTNSLSSAKELITNFLKEYKENKVSEKLPPLALVIDSIDRLLTDSHVKKDEAGEMYQDQGLHAKMLKQFSSDLAQGIGDQEIFGIVTKQPYKNQDTIMSKVEPWIITDSIKFPFSQILLVTNVRLKDKKTNEIEGITATAFAYKTRFCKPRQKVKVDIPYDISLDAYSGILDAAVSAGVLEKNGGWYNFGGEKFQESSSNEYMEAIFAKLVETDEDTNIVFDVELGDNELEDHEIGKPVNSKRKKKASLDD